MEAEVFGNREDAGHGSKNATEPPSATPKKKPKAKMKMNQATVGAPSSSTPLRQARPKAERQQPLPRPHLAEQNVNGLSPDSLRRILTQHHGVGNQMSSGGICQEMIEEGCADILEIEKDSCFNGKYGPMRNSVSEDGHLVQKPAEIEGLIAQWGDTPWYQVLVLESAYSQELALLTYLRSEFDLFRKGFAGYSFYERLMFLCDLETKCSYALQPRVRSAAHTQATAKTNWIFCCRRARNKSDQVTNPTSESGLWDPPVEGLPQELIICFGRAIESHCEESGLRLPTLRGIQELSERMVSLQQSEFPTSGEEKETAISLRDWARTRQETHNDELAKNRDMVQRLGTMFDKHVATELSELHRDMSMYSNMLSSFVQGLQSSALEGNCGFLQARWDILASLAKSKRTMAWSALGVVGQAQISQGRVAEGCLRADGDAMARMIDLQHVLIPRFTYHLLLLANVREAQILRAKNMKLSLLAGFVSFWASVGSFVTNSTMKLILPDYVA